MKNKKQLFKIRTQLLKRLNEIETSAAQIKTEIAESSENQTNFLRDYLDHAKEQTEINSRLEIYNRYLKEHSQILAAMQRLNNGTFGECRECGDEISDNRINVQPSASFCLECQHQKEDHKGLKAVSALKINPHNALSLFIFRPEVA